MITRTLSEIAKRCGAVVESDDRADFEIVGLAGIEDARPGEITFLANMRYQKALEATRASAVVIGHDVQSERTDLVFLRCDDPNTAFSEVVRFFAEESIVPEPGIHPSAVIGGGAEFGEDVSIGPLCVVGAGARVGARTVLSPGVVVGPGVTIGDDCELGANASVHARASIGDRCIVHPSAVIGSEGFGFAPAPAGWAKIPQCGTVIIEDDVEIGASSTIDRARFGATRIGRGAKLDNLVHIAHNVVVGAGALLVAQVGIAGSARIGNGAVFGGQSGVAGHSIVGAGAQVAARAGVFGDLEGGREYFGFPARPRREALRSMAQTRRIPDLLDRVRRLEARLAELEPTDSVGPEGAHSK